MLSKLLKSYVCFSIFFIFSFNSFGYLTDGSYRRICLILDNKDNPEQFGYDSKADYFKNKKFSLDEVMNLLVDSGKDILFENCEIAGSSAFKPKIKNPKFNKDGLIVINNRVIFLSCKFTRCFLSDLEFKERIYFEDCKFESYSTILIKNCILNQGLYCSFSEFSSIGFIGCRINKGLYFNNNDIKNYLTIEKCHFSSTDDGMIDDRVYVPSIKSIIIYQFLKDNFYVFSQSTSAPYDIGIDSSFFTDKISLHTHLTSLMLGNDTINSHTDFKLTQINDVFKVKNCIFKGKISFEDFNCPVNSTDFDWEMLNGYKLSLFRTKISDDKNSTKGSAQNKKQKKFGVYPLDGFTIETLEDYKTLLQTYNLFRNIYNARWDQQSVNECYIEMKTLETVWLKKQYESSGSFRDFLSWQLNLFLEKFCEFGTDPVKSIFISFYVLLAFAGFYFLFPHEWDLFSRKELAFRLKNLIFHLTGKHIIHNESAHTKHEKKLFFNEFTEQYQSNKKNLPLFVKVVSWLLILSFGFTGNVNERKLWNMSFLNQDWNKLSFFGKLRVSFLLSSSLGLYFFFAFIVRAVNSMTLSLNAFSTLGFGSIPTKGFSRNLAVIEGFTGWFLLSLFSVSLITQLLR